MPVKGSSSAPRNPPRARHSTVLITCKAQCWFAKVNTDHMGRMEGAGSVVMPGGMVEIRGLPPLASIAQASGAALLTGP